MNSPSTPRTPNAPRSSREKAIPPIAGTRLPDGPDRLIERSTATNQPDDAQTYRAPRA